MMMDGGECVAHRESRPGGLVWERGGGPGVWPHTSPTRHSPLMQIIGNKVGGCIFSLVSISPMTKHASFINYHPIRV